ncbi:glycosyltransferase family 8 protein [Pedobacter cryoconitis]|uniref:Lipopolysaccharide biosynthesis glycosyltransferase n=1 Tax=Pedobacter cryoconitis TaxID=188932 RepID=A0A7X0J4G3_9SPHI|nr:glycosyltransferase family 8 protein [Pedobacter cryoconitis]MBB6500969.1 lipopolysaccharide biosynthesis glycosyltransferase [Pedobacter cryoconitis]
MDEKNTQHIPLILAFTPSYLVPAAACILSVKNHATSRDCFHFICLLTQRLSTESEDMLVKLGGTRCRFSFIDLEGKLTDLYIDEKYTIAASYRLLLPDLLPEYDKVLYIDCDMIFQNNLADLYHSIYLKDNYMAGVFEATLDSQQAHMNAIGCEPGKYINSGLLLMNLAQLRKDNMVEKFLEAAKVEGLEFPDQDVINQLCRGKIVGLPPYCNSIRTFLLPQYKKIFLQYYTVQDWQNVQHKGNVHYTGPKPWVTFTIAFDLWWKYYEKLPGKIKQQASFNLKVQILSRVYRTWFGKILINTVRSLYRKVRNSEG